MEKLLENTYRNINIALINELAILCDKMGNNVWEVVDAAKTKPYGFQPFYPGPGVGGHCIPLDPYYLAWKAREYGFHTSMIESAAAINDRMPEYCVDRISRILNHSKKPLNGSHILMLGVAYKQDISDYRESPALEIIRLLLMEGAQVDYYDPHIPQYQYRGIQKRGLAALSPEALREYDLAVISAAHTTVAYGTVLAADIPVFDLKNVLKGESNRKNIEVL